MNDRELAIVKLEIRKLSESRNCGLCVVYTKKMELRYWLVRANVKNSRVNKLNEKRSLTP